MTKRAMLYVLLLVGVLTTGVFVGIAFLNDDASERISAATVAAPEKNSPDTTDPFELGQYYFNHDDDPGGPYDLDKAQQYYLSAIEQDPRGNELQWHQSGRIDFILGNYSSAIYKFNKQIEYFGTEIPNVYYMLGLTYGYRAREYGNPEDWQKAEEAFKIFMDNYYFDWASRLDLSWVYFAQGKYEEMKPLLEKTLEVYPDIAWVHNMYGLALMNTGELERAKEHFYKAHEQAAALTTADWGKAYPGNDPADWPQGLSEFRGAIEKNIVLIEEKLAARE